MCFNVFLPPGVVVNVVSPGSLWFVFLHLLQNNVDFFSQLHAAAYFFGAGVLLCLCAPVYVCKLAFVAETEPACSDRTHVVSPCCPVTHTLGNREKKTRQ